MKTLVAVIALVLGLSAALAACQDGDEELIPAVTATPVPSGSSSPVETATPTSSPPAAIEPCAEPPVDARTLAPTLAGATGEYTDAEGKYAVSYPANWKPCRDMAFEATGSGIQFIAEDGLTHAKIYVFANLEGLALEQWLQENDPIFLDKERTREERLIAGARALYSPVDAEGLPRSEAYVDGGSQIVFVSALRVEEFSALTSQFKFLTQ